SAGQIIRITELNDLSLPVLATSGGWQRLRKQTTSVVSKTDTTVTISPPLYLTLKSNLSPQLVPAAEQGKGVGVENLRVNGKETKGRLIDFEQCYGCWIKDVHAVLGGSYVLFLVDSLRCEVRHSNIDELNHQGSNGAGLLMQASSACLIEDNIIFKCFPHVE